MPGLRRAIVAALPLALFSPTADADIGVPLIAIFLPPMWFAFVPIVVVEAVVLARRLDISLARAVTPAFVGNLLSTAIGVPLLWLVLAVMELICCGTARGLNTFGTRLYAVTIQSPWLIPYEQDLRWMVPCALVVMAIPSFAASVILEAPVNRLFIRSVPGRSLWRATAAANLCSYGMLALLLWPAWKLTDRMPGFWGLIGEWFVEATFKAVSVLTGRR